MRRASLALAAAIAATPAFTAAVFAEETARSAVIHALVAAEDGCEWTVVPLASGEPRVYHESPTCPEQVAWSDPEAATYYLLDRTLFRIDWAEPGRAEVVGPLPAAPSPEAHNIELFVAQETGRLRVARLGPADGPEQRDAQGRFLTFGGERLDLDPSLPPVDYGGVWALYDLGKGGAWQAAGLRLERFYATEWPGDFIEATKWRHEAAGTISLRRLRETAITGYDLADAPFRLGEEAYEDFRMAYHITVWEGSVPLYHEAMRWPIGGGWLIAGTTELGLYPTATAPVFFSADGIVPERGLELGAMEDPVDEHSGAVVELTILDDLLLVERLDGTGQAAVFRHPETEPLVVVDPMQAPNPIGPIWSWLPTERFGEAVAP